MTPDRPGEHDAGAAARPQASMDTLVGTLLLIGVAISMVLIASGLVWAFARSGHAVLHYRIIGMNFYRFAAATGRSVARGHLTPALLVNAGIVTLMLTPFLRVFASVLYFAGVQRNAKYTLFTLFVLVVLAWSLFFRF
jgi:uncharacterized membrane protein